jgi:prepilin-type N-terminal cleavage/methylation domain-containing protein
MTHRNLQGFTLIEMAIVLLIVGLLLGGGMNMMSASSDVARYKESQNNMNDIKDTILGLYVNKKFLPCPDTNNPPDGFGNYTDGTGVGTSSTNFTGAAGGTCSSLEGWLPYNDLGIGGNGDAWGERIKYVVSPAFDVVAATTFCSTYSRVTANKITIQDLQAAPVTLGDWAGFALISTGKNGRITNSGMAGAFTGDGGCAALDAREKANCSASNSPTIVRYGTQMTDGTNVVFDDMVLWVGDMQLISELRKSGGCSIASTPPIVPPITPSSDPTSRNPTTFTADLGKTTNNYNANDNIATSAGDDKVIINQNQNKNLDLQDGNNTLDIGQNSNATVTSGTGNDIVRVQGNLNQPVNLGAGNDVLEVWGNSNATIDMGVGNDSVRIEGDINRTISLGSGTNSIYVRSHINANISATGGTATVYYDSENMSIWEKAHVSGLTTKCRADSHSAWTDC